MGFDEDWGRSVMDVTMGAKPSYMKADVMIGSRTAEREAVKGSVQGLQISGGQARSLDLVAANDFKLFATDWELRCSRLTGLGAWQFMNPIVDSVSLGRAFHGAFPTFPVIGHYGLIRAELVIAPKEALEKLQKQRPGAYATPPDALQVLLGWGVPCYVYDGRVPPDGADRLEHGGVFYVNVVTNPMGRVLRCPGGRTRDDSIEDSDPTIFLLVASLLARVGARVAGKLIKSLVRRVKLKLDERAAMRAVAELEREELEEFTAARAKWLRGEAEVLKGGLDAATQTALEQAKEVMPRVMNRIVDGSSNLVKPVEFKVFHRTMQEEGFSLYEADTFGPEGGYQLFYRKGNVVARFKTKGNAPGAPARVGDPHISFSLTDGQALKWENDLAKINAQGKLRPKMIVEADKMPRMNVDMIEKGTRPYWYVEDRSLTKAGQDAWANATHFNTPAGFRWDGLEEIIAPVLRRR